MSNKTPTPSAPILTLDDFTVVVKLIDVVTKRGAFEGPELSDVGTLRNKFAAFLEANKQKAPPEPSLEPAPPQAS
jgi:hypothetical protein